MSGKAYFVARNTVQATGAVQRFYRVEPPHEGHDHIAVTALGTGPQTLIFPANAEGDIVSWRTMAGSFVGGADHHRALELAGYGVG